MRNFAFRRLTKNDLPLMRDWLLSPHVRAWWPDAEKQTIKMLQDMDSPDINMLLVSLGDHPFAYIHDHSAHAYNQLQFADLPPGTRVISTFVGDPSFAGQGHAAAYIDARVRDLRLNHLTIAAGPNAKNIHAISTYASAKFAKRRLATARDGRLVQVMTRL